MSNSDYARLANPDVEAALLGVLLVAPYLLDELDVCPDHFFIHRHRMIFAALAQMAQGEIEIDPLTVADHLESAGELQAVGGSAALMKLLLEPPQSARVNEYARILRNRYHRRRLVSTAQQVAKIAYDLDSDLEAELPEILAGLVGAVQAPGGAVPMEHFLSTLWDEIETRQNDPRDVWGIPTGFGRLDHVTGGLQPGESLLISGKPGVGKSILAVQLGAQLAESAPGAIYSLEMLGVSVSRRLLSARAGVYTSQLKSGQVPAGDWPRLVQAFAELECLPVFLSDASSWTVPGLKADLARLKSQHGIQWFVVDYLYLMDAGQGRDEIERTALISKGIKQICKDLELAGVSVHSLTKAGMSGVPGMEDLRGSGQLSFDADLITFLTEFVPMGGMIPDEIQRNKENVRVLWFDKGRELENPKRYLYLVKRPGFPAFGEMETLSAGTGERMPGERMPGERRPHPDRENGKGLHDYTV